VDQATHNKIVSFIWGIADDVLRDLFKRGKYPDVILPMCVIRRMDAVLEPTKQAVLDTRKMLDEAGITEQSAALCDAAGQAFYNTSRFTLRDLKSRGSQQQLLADFEDYLNGFSPNVQDIIDNFKFRNQLTTLSKADAIGTLINRFLDPDIDLSPAGIDNHSMGTVFEELVRKFNEENNEEAGEHWTPRDAVRLMANLVFLPIEAKIKSGTYPNRFPSIGREVRGGQSGYQEGWGMDRGCGDRLCPRGRPNRSDRRLHCQEPRSRPQAGWEGSATAWEDHQQPCGPD
jgi:type I restriction enzyme M protein